MTMILSTSVYAAPGWEEDLMNPIPPDYYDIIGPDQYTEEEHSSISPYLLIDADDNQHIIWSDSRNDIDPDDGDLTYEMFYKKIDANGNVLVDDTRLTDATVIPLHLQKVPGINRQFAPVLAAEMDSDDDIHITYTDYSRHLFAGDLRINAEVYYMKLSGGLDTGGTAAAREDLVLVDEQRVSTAGAHSGSSDIAIDSDGNVHMVWYDHRSAYWNWEIYYEKLSNDGDILIDDTRLTYYLDYCAAPEIAIDSEDNLHVVFKSYNWDGDMNYIYYMKLDNNANHLIYPTMITSEGKTTPNPYGKGYPLIVIDSEDNVHMAWHDERDANNDEVYYLEMNNVGVPQSPGIVRITENSGESAIQAMAPVQSFDIDDQDRLYFGWRDSSPGEFQVHLAIMNPDGSMLLPTYKVTISNTLSESPDFAFDSDGNIHMAWSDSVLENQEIFHVKLVPRTIEIAFVPTGVPGGSIDVTIYEDDTVVDGLTVARSCGNPLLNAVTTTLMVKDGSSYSADLDLTGITGKSTGNGAVPLKVYLVENGELTDQIGRTVVNNNNGKNPKLISTIALDI
jgi:hypothetical protein